MDEYNASPESTSKCGPSEMLTMLAIWIVLGSLIIFFAVQVWSTFDTNGKLANGLNQQKAVMEQFVTQNRETVNQGQVTIQMLEALSRELLAIRNDSQTARKIIKDLGISVQNQPAAANTDTTGSGAAATGGSETPEPDTEE